MSLFTRLTKPQLTSLDDRPITTNDSNYQSERIKRQLVALGAVRYDTMLPETKSLSQIIRSDETIYGIVYGKYTISTFDRVVVGRGAMLVTNQRILLVDHKPFFLKSFDIPFFAVSSVSYSRIGLAGTVMLHTKMGNAGFRTFNKRCAQGFVAAIQKHVLAPRGNAYA